MNLVDHLDEDLDGSEQNEEHIDAPVGSTDENRVEKLLETPDIEVEAVNEHSSHTVHQHRLLIARNICVGFAALLFLCSLLPVAVLPHIAVYPMRGVAYLFGAVAYVSELMVLSNLFRHKRPLRHMFMPYVFGFLYLLLGISYLRH